MNLEISHDFEPQDITYDKRCQLLYFYYRHVMGFTRSKSKKLLRKFEPGYLCDYGYNECYGSDCCQASPPITWEEEYAQFVKADDEYVKSQEETEMDIAGFLHMHYNYGYTRLFGHNPVNATLDQDELWDYLSSSMYNGHFQSEFVLNLKIRRSANRFSRLGNGKLKRITNRHGGHKFWAYARYAFTDSVMKANRGIKRQTATKALTKAQAYLDYINGKVDNEVVECRDKVQIFTLTIPSKKGKGVSTCTCVYKPNHSFTMLG